MPTFHNLLSLCSISLRLSVMLLLANLVAVIVIYANLVAVVVCHRNTPRLIWHFNAMPHALADLNFNVFQLKRSLYMFALVLLPQ